MKSPRAKAESLPHSWPAKDWPAHVFPGNAQRAKHVLRSNRTELLADGALARVGREIIVFGEGYGRWLARKTGRVDGYEIAPNRTLPETREAA